MWPFDRLKLRPKLALLAGVPVVGVLILSLLIAQDARQRAATADALGSMQDLAELTVRMAEVAHEVQMERATTALATGVDSKDAAVGAQWEHTDAALSRLESFLAIRDVSRFPPPLARGLTSALEKLRHRAAFREEAHGREFPIEKALDYYGAINEALIGATAALTQLSDDAQLLRSISSLVATMEVKERGSREHALLANVFAIGEYPPGMYRYYVTLVTQEGVYADALRNAATDEQYRLYADVQKESAALSAAKMRQTALDTTDDSFQIDPKVWFETDAAKMNALRRVEGELSKRVELAASSKLSGIKRAVRTSAGIVAVVVVVSLLLAWLIARGINQSVSALVGAAARVRQDRDYGIRAAKTSRDELGVLTDAFNEMLSGIQARDRELEDHRQNLEKLVEQRTQELVRRNEDMRLVLDNVEQGLATIDRTGKLSPERSAAFERWFGRSGADHFADSLAPGEERTNLALRLAFEQVVEDILPVDIAIEQMPRRFNRGDSEFALSFKPLMHDGHLEGVLVVATDITAELHARAAEAAQREQIKMFEHAMKDRGGFVEFFQECRALIEKVRDDQFADLAERMRTVHTVKGNTALYGVTSVAEIAHALEQALVDANLTTAEKETSRLLEAWDAFAARVVPIIGEDFGERVEVPLAELDAVIDAARTGKPLASLEQMLHRMRLEPIRLRFDRVAEQLVSLSKRLGKGEPEIVVRANEVRMPIGHYARFWSAFVHVVRNIVDHGFQSEEDRLASGKPERNRVEVHARYEGSNVVIEISDDGKGVDWQKVGRLAKERGLAAETHDDLVKALMAPGLSTREQVTSTSGRGVGMGEVAEACHALGGSIAIESELGKGTRFRFTLPTMAVSGSLLPRLSVVPVSGRPRARTSTPPPVGVSLRARGRSSAPPPPGTVRVSVKPIPSSPPTGISAPTKT